jgi:aspartate racemase
MTNSTAQRGQRPNRVVGERIVGVIGGMGPRATMDFMSKVVRLTPARQDQNHIRMIVDHNPKIPDRTESILAKHHEIISAIVDSAKVLQEAGADFLAMPCNQHTSIMRKLKRNARYRY